MRHEKDRLVPIGEVVGELDVPMPAIPAASPQARHHFTIPDQADQIVAASEADPGLGFMARLLALCSLPRANPGNQKEYQRLNGTYKLVIFSSGETKLPYGNISRLLLAWLCTEAVRTQSRVLILGSSLSEFMRKLGITSTDGRTQSSLCNQMDRLFNAHVSLIYSDERGKATVNSRIAARTELWWDPKRLDVPMLWESKIELSEDLFNEIVNRPVPLDMNTLTALKSSSLCLDLYLWVAYRISTLRAPLHIPWPHLYGQFGTDPAKASDKFIVRNFRQNVLRELKKIKLAWPELNYEAAPGMLILHPSVPVIPPAQQLSPAEKSPRVHPRRKDETENIHRNLPKGE